MAVDMFLKIDDVKGESLDAEHTEEIQVLSWNWGVTQTGTTHNGPGAGAGKADVHDVTLTKFVDRSSPILYKLCLKGTHLDEAILTTRKAGDTPLEYIVITLKDAIISTVQTGGSGHDERLMETVGINFAKVEFNYTPQKADGSGDAEVPMTWNIAANNESIS